MIEHAPENQLERYPFWSIDEWRQDLPEGRIERIYTHWSAHDYYHVFPAYHFCIAMTQAGEIVVAYTHEVRENMRHVYEAPDAPYAPHTRGRNSFALGISIMAMEGCTPHDFGRYPLTEPLIDALCRVGARLANIYAIPVDAEHVMSHAEAALLDGYFGTEPEQRWDIARLRPAPDPLEPREAVETGEELRSRMRSWTAKL